MLTLEFLNQLSRDGRIDKINTFALKRYGIKEYQRYREWIIKIYPQRCREFNDIAYLSEKDAERKYLGRVLDAIAEAKDKGSPVFIYGAGRHGTEFASYLDKRKIFFDGFLVSAKEGNPNVIAGHYVYEARAKIRNGHTLIIIVVAKGSVDLIKKMIDEISDNPNDVLSLEEIL